MGWADQDSFLTKLFSGDPITILISFIVTITLPALLHWYFYTQAAEAALAPTFLLLGPSGSGKTTFVSALQRRLAGDSEPSVTRTSQEPSTTALFLSTSVPLGSNKYRSDNDFETTDAAKNPTRFLAVDTPGHGKLRLEHGLSQLSNPATRGVIFMVDSTNLESASGDEAGDSIRDTATYLHDTLLALQRRKTGKNAAKTKIDVPVLIAANKQDLFTALPAGAIKDRLQTELEKVRRSRSKAITTVDSDPDREEEDDMLGSVGEEKFSFRSLEEEFDIVVDVVGGSLRGGEDTSGSRKWEEWIGSCL